MKTMVGIDVDDTLADLIPSLCRYLTIEFGFDITPSSFRRSYHLSQVMGWPPGTSAPYLRAHESTPEYAAMSVVRDSQEGVLELAKKYELHAVTARHEGLRLLTQEWVHVNYPSMFTDIHFTNGIRGRTHKKTEVCRKLGIGVAVEDHPDYATHLSENGISVVLLNKPWNEGVAETPRLKRAYSWEEVVPAVHRFARAA